MIQGKKVAGGSLQNYALAVVVVVPYSSIIIIFYHFQKWLRL